MTVLVIKPTYTLVRGTDKTPGKGSNVTWKDDVKARNSTPTSRVVVPTQGDDGKLHSSDMKWGESQMGRTAGAKP